MSEIVCLKQLPFCHHGMSNLQTVRYCAPRGGQITHRASPLSTFSRTLNSQKIWHTWNPASIHFVYVDDENSDFVECCIFKEKWNTVELCNRLHGEIVDILFI